MAALGSAAIVPRNTADGIYAVTLDARGQEVHTRLPDDAELPQDLNLSAYDKREETKNTPWKSEDLNTFCTCGNGADKHDTDAAVQDLQSQLGQGKKFNYLSVYSKRGDVVAFACKEAKLEFAETSAKDVELIMAEVRSACGAYTPGSANFKVKRDGTNRALTYGFMKLADKDVEFCRMATASYKVPKCNHH
ncbi:hypothetical protein JDV02_009343 [Purpureocillium takamizusanense]|uniref:Uncharacterized protein n=1 Tax=Purpureocillium takamizusanense TaxID=2060973 RepID=A0A9Q8VG26_9HYPO|nr:uncharacterized protein JDV02_009343 [Purpureocillium takamizusanense]UNI23524.1 hypothetical protein JDV02_009343 [Purpureocillium takamizusanense]